MRYGLEEKDIEKLCTLFTQYTEIEKVILYGSRAKGTHKPFSDVDITLVGSDIKMELLTLLSLEIDELLLPYSFDISIFGRLNNAELIEHIQRRGVVLYEKSNK
jgi:predicted nucleotidyltransferase